MNYKLLGKSGLRVSKLALGTMTFLSWRIQVSDPDIAETQLVPLALDGGNVTICGFERQARNLEDIFMHIVEESNHER